MFKNHILPVMGSWILSGISKQDAQKFITDMTNIEAGKKLSRSTIQNIKIKTSELFKYAAQMDYIESNPFEYVIVPKEEDDFLATDEEETKRNFLYKDELLELLNTFESNFDYSIFALFRLLAFSGARKGEILALKTNDIDFNRSGIKITKTLYFKDGEFYLMKTKNKQSRFVPLDDLTLQILKKHIKNLNEQKLEIQSLEMDYDDQQYLFPRQDGRPQRLAAPNEWLIQAYKKTDMNVIKVHGLRHSYASMLFAEGKPPKKIQALLGHKSINITMDVYTHISEFYNAEQDTFEEKLFNHL